MASVRVRRAAPTDALVVAALQLQAGRARGAAPEPGFLDRFAAAWDADGHPTWVAELDGSHAGVLVAQVVADLPWPGRAPTRGLRLVTHFAAGDDADVLDALTEAMAAHARTHGLDVTRQGRQVGGRLTG